MNWRETIGAAVKAGRTQAGLTQEELAGKISRSTRALSNIERGRVSPSLDTLYAISRTLKVPMSDFFVDVGRKKSQRRVEMELKAREILRSLGDKDLEYEVGHLLLLDQRK